MHVSETTLCVRLRSYGSETRVCFRNDARLRNYAHIRNQASETIYISVKTTC